MLINNARVDKLHFVKSARVLPPFFFSFQKIWLCNYASPKLLPHSQKHTLFELCKELVLFKKKVVKFQKKNKLRFAFKA